MGMTTVQVQLLGCGSPGAYWSRFAVLVVGLNATPSTLPWAHA
jgi:hypothetical protein